MAEEVAQLPAEVMQMAAVLWRVLLLLQMVVGWMGG